MKKISLLFVLLFVFLVSCTNSQPLVSIEKNTTEPETVVELPPVLNSEIFLVNMPSQFDNLFNTTVTEKSVSIYDKECQEQGYPGYVFGIYAFLSPDEYSGGPAEKVGELRLNNDKLYDIVIHYPTESQFGFDRSMPEKFKNLFASRYDIVKNITGVNGEQFKYRYGCDGEGLYDDILKKHKQALEENWDITKLIDESMSAKYYTKKNKKNKKNKNATDKLNKFGYVYKDINVDGIEELIIGEIKDDDDKGMIYDLYTMVNRVPTHVISSSDDDKYFSIDTEMICRETMPSKNEKEYIVYNVVNNSTDCFFQRALKIDTKNKKYYQSFNIDDNDGLVWEEINEEKFNEDSQYVNDYNRFDFTPFSSIE